MTEKRNAILLLAFLCLGTAGMAGGGWVKSKGQGYYKIGMSVVSEMGYFSGGTTYSPRLDAELLTLSAYAEHGIGKGLSLEGYIPLFMHHSVEGIVEENGQDLVLNDAASGVGDINIALRKSLLSSELINWSGTFLLGLPTGKANQGKRMNLFTGDDEFNQTIRTDISTSFGGKNWGGYFTLYTGVNFRSRNFKNEFLYGAELGASTLGKRLWLIGRIVGVETSGNSETQFSNSFTQSMSFTNYMIEALFFLDKKTGINASYTGTIEGNIPLIGSVYSIGLFRDIN